MKRITCVETLKEIVYYFLNLKSLM